MAVLLCEYEEDGEAVPCRPVAFILALPFMLLGMVLTIVGILLYPFALICPCGCFIELAIWLVKVPVTVMKKIALCIPC